jgi:hypothetical protein
LSAYVYHDFACHIGLAVARSQQRFWVMCYYVYGLNVCYNDDPVITIGPVISSSRPLMCRMQLCFPFTSFVAILLLWPQHSQHSSVKHFLLKESCGYSPFLIIPASAIPQGVKEMTLVGSNAESSSPLQKFSTRSVPPQTHLMAPTN